MSLQLVQSLDAHEGKCWAIAWNPSGDKLVSCGEDRIVNVWAPKDNKSDSLNENGWRKIARFGEGHHVKTLRDICWSPCGKYLAVGSFDAVVTIWEMSKSSFNCIATLEGHESEVKSVSWSSSGDYVASCSRDRTVMIWGVQSGNEIDCCAVLTNNNYQDVKKVVWSPHEDILISGGYDNMINVHMNDPTEGDWVCLSRLSGHDSTVWGIDFDITGTRIVSGSEDCSLRFWKRKGKDYKDWTCSAVLQGFHDFPIYDVKWNKSNHLVATACGDNFVRIFEEEPTVSGQYGVDNFVMKTNIEAHEQDVNCVDWNPKEPSLLASAGEDGKINLWFLNSDASI